MDWWNLVKTVGPWVAAAVNAVFLAGMWWMHRRIRERDHDRFESDTTRGLEEGRTEAGHLRERVQGHETRLEVLEQQSRQALRERSEMGEWLRRVVLEVVRTEGLSLQPTSGERDEWPPTSDVSAGGGP